MDVTLRQTPFDEAFHARFRSASAAIFDSEADERWLNSLHWRLDNMPDASVFYVEENDTLIGIKAGHANAYDRYYSWLGGVHPDHRGCGIAEALMVAQHEWLRPSRFRLVETHVAQSNAAMIQLNTKHGFEETGQFLKSGEPYLILQKGMTG